MFLNDEGQAKNFVSRYVENLTTSGLVNVTKTQRRKLEGKIIKARKKSYFFLNGMLRNNNNEKCILPEQVKKIIIA